MAWEAISTSPTYSIYRMWDLAPLTSSICLGKHHMAVSNCGNALSKNNHAQAHRSTLKFCHNSQIYPKTLHGRARPGCSSSTLRYCSLSSGISSWVARFPKTFNLTVLLRVFDCSIRVYQSYKIFIGMQGTAGICGCMPCWALL